MNPLFLLLQASPPAAALHHAIGQAMTKDQQLFVSANWPGLAVWLATDEGKIALQTFIQDWQQSRLPQQ
jgi:hypothetical protein